MSNIASVTDETFDAAVRHSPVPVLVEFWAQRCGPCRQLSPVLEQIAAEHRGVLAVVKVNSDENPHTVHRYQVMLVPTLAVFAGGEPVKQVIGARSKSAPLREPAEFIAPQAARA
jgi:thioredoxin 1